MWRSPFVMLAWPDIGGIDVNSVHMRFIAIVISLATPIASLAGVTIGVDKLSVVHKSSKGVTIAFPDVCKTPAPAGPVPIPYPNRRLAPTKNDKRTNVVRYSLKIKTEGELRISQASEGSSKGDRQSTTVDYIDGKGKITPLREHSLVKLANGDLCAICAAKNGTVKAVYRLIPD